MNQRRTRILIPVIAIMLTLVGCKTTTTTTDSATIAPRSTPAAQPSSWADTTESTVAAAAEAAMKQKQEAADRLRAAQEAAEREAAEQRRKMEAAQASRDAAAQAEAAAKARAAMEASEKAAAEAKAAADAAARAVEEERKRAKAAAEKERIRLEREAEARRREAAENARRAEKEQEEARKRAAEMAAQRAEKERAEAQKRVAALPPPGQPTPASTGIIRGSIMLDTGRSAAGSDEVFIVAKPTSGSARSSSGRTSREHHIEMTDKQFRPKFLFAQVGDMVKFKNLDPFQHNVFSLSGANKFDLGTYGRGTDPSHTFLHPGVVKVYCNIHPDMASFIMISEYPWGTITNSSGEYQLSQLPPGDYTVEAWSIRGSTESTVALNSGGTAQVDMKIDGKKYKRKQHRNKFGKKYKKSADEFY